MMIRFLTSRLFIGSLLYFAGFLLISAIAYGAFHLYQWFNWEFGYEENTRQTIMQMVKPECIKEEL